MKLFKNSKKGLSLVLVLSMILMLIPANVMADGETAWEELADTTWYDGGSDSYTIKTAADLAGLASLVNSGTTMSGVTITLENDIDLSGYEWSPIGNISYAFAGTFDGDGHSIEGLTITEEPAVSSSSDHDYIGLFGQVAGTVTDFTVDGNVTITADNTTASYIGSAVGHITSGEVSYVISKANVSIITSNKGPRAGGVVGSVQGATSGVCATVECCIFEGTLSVTGTTNDVTGGITGYLNNGAVENCANLGTVYTSTTKGSVGGILGYSASSKAYIKSCYNYGSVSGGQYTGAVMGRINNASFAVENCYYLSDSISGVGTTSSGWTGSTEEFASKTAEEFASGEVAYLLNEEVTDGTQVWYQNIDNGQTVDSYPVVYSTHGTVYAVAGEEGKYTNITDDDFTLGVSSDGTTEVAAEIASGEGEAEMYVLVEAGSIDTYYDETTYPTTTATFTNTDMTECNYVFAGWYTYEDDYVAMTSFPTTDAYAKFVDENILTVKSQLTSGTSAASESTAVRFVSTVDSLDYETVGFKVAFNGKEITSRSTNVYTSLTGANGTVEYTYSPTIFGSTSAYFFALTIKNVPNSYFDSAFEVTPYWITMDGTTVYGVERDVVISEIY